MKKAIVLALPLAALLLFAGCESASDQAAVRPAPGSNIRQPAPAAAAPANQQQAAAPAPAPMPARRTTTQPLPQGYNYIRIPELAAGPAQSVPAAPQQQPGI